MSGLHKHLPVPESAMHFVSPRYTICQMLRDIYWLSEGNKRVQIRARVAMSMAKSMSAKLIEYNQSWAEDYWDDNSWYEKIKKEVIGD